MFTRNQKYSKMTRKETPTISINLDIVSLQLFCNFIVSENKNIHKSNIINLNNLINNLDMKIYENDSEKIEKINFIKKGIEARLNYNLNKKDLIMMHINGGLLDNNINKSIEEINNDEIIWINKIVADALKFGFIYSEVDKLENLCNSFKTADYSSKTEVLQLFKDTIYDIQNKFRQSDSNASSDLYFSLSEDKFDECIRTTYDKITSPSNRLVTGLTGLNEMLGGGYESKRVYALFGLPSEGKSITLLDMALQIKKYNTGYRCKDPTKRPCVVYFTLENDLEETIARLCEMSGIDGSMSDYSIDELIMKLRTEGELYLNSASPIDIIMKYKPGMSVDTSYLYTLTEELEDDGYETIAVIIDYIKRIRSSLDNSDTRVWLGNVVNEFKVFASTKDLVVISASQLNRDATSHIDESRKANKSDLVRMLGRSQIGESLLILENLDGAFLIAPEWTKEGQKFLGFQRIKKRYKASDLTYLYYPYKGDIKLLEDLNALEPVYKTTMRDIPQNFNNLKHINTLNDVQDISDAKLLTSSNNIFLSGSMSVIDDEEDDYTDNEYDDIPIYNNIEEVPVLRNDIVVKLIP